ncbi:MAG: hypothetical protein ACRD4E_17405, partial [Bryobacteraceae bacterium]
ADGGRRGGGDEASDGSPVTGLRAALCLALVLAACSDATAPSGTSAADGADLLRRAVEAEKSLVYTGEKRTICGEEGEGRATRMKVSRTAAGKTYLEWNQGGGGARRFVYESRAGWRDDPDLLLRNYSVTLDPADGPAVAWRETRHLLVRGRRPGRPSLDLYVDKDTSLVLREEMRDFEGKLWLTKVFDSVDFRAPDEPSAAAQAEPISDPLAARIGTALVPLAVSSAPAGFVRAADDSSRRADGVLREDWTDGLAAFSVIERRKPAAERAPEGELRRRRCSGRASVSGVLCGIDVTVVGNLPVTDLESVARGLVPSKTQD